MRPSYCYGIEGSNALASVSHAQLRLVPASDDTTTSRASSSSKRSSSPTLVVAALAVVLVLGAISTIVSNMRYEMNQAALNATPTEVITVMPGDSLWTVASRHAVDRVGTTDIVDWLKVRNGLQSSSLSVGQKLVVPLATQ